MSWVWKRYAACGRGVLGVEEVSWMWKRLLDMEEVCWVWKRYVGCGRGEMVWKS